MGKYPVTSFPCYKRKVGRVLSGLMHKTSEKSVSSAFVVLDAPWTSVPNPLCARILAHRSPCGGQFLKFIWHFLLWSLGYVYGYGFLQ